MRQVSSDNCSVSAGMSHLAYVPGKEVVGFGRLSALIDVFAHRLVLQEELARQIARALQDELGSQGAACLIRAEQTCFRLRGEEQHAAVTFSEAYEGVLKEKALRAELWHRVDAVRRPRERAMNLDAGLRAELAGLELRDDDATRATYGHDESDQGDFRPAAGGLPEGHRRGAARGARLQRAPGAAHPRRRAHRQERRLAPHRRAGSRSRSSG